MINDPLCHMQIKGVRMVRHEGFDDIPVRLNLALLAAVAIAHGYLFFALPVLLDWSPWTLLLLPPALCTVITNGVLVHEAVHGLLFPGRRGNLALGRICGVLAGVCFDLQRYDHLQHHVHSSTVRNAADVHVLHPDGSGRMPYPRYLYNGIIGLYLAEFVFNLSTCLRSQASIRRQRCPTECDDRQTSGQIAMRLLLSRNRLTAVRIDGACIAVLHLLSLAAFHSHLEWFVVIFVARAILLTTLDSLSHFKTPVNAPWFAKNIRLPCLLERWVFLHFTLHGVHHVHPDQCWVTLPALRDANPRGIAFVYHQGLWGALLDKFRPPVHVMAFPAQTCEFATLRDAATIDTDVRPPHTETGDTR